MSSEHRQDTAPPRPAPRTLPDRAAVRAAAVAAIAGAGHRWAWLGPVGAPDRWVGECGPKDLDLWCEERAAGGDDPAAALASALSCARIVESDRPGRLRHVILATETPTGPAVVDLDFGDLRVGPVLLVPAGEVRSDPASKRLVGAAAVADLLVRPLLRGRIPAPDRLAEAADAWRATGPDERAAMVLRLRRTLGSGVTRRVLDVLAGGAVDPTLPRRARTRLLLQSIAPANLRGTWAERSMVIPARGAAGPLGLRVRGVVVALIGTDGAGKSTVAAELDQRLRRFGLSTGSAYFGMGRGNLPGVVLARRAVGALRARKMARTGQVADPAAPAARATDHPRLRRAAAWFYAAEYIWRYLRLVLPQRHHRRVVIVDRWVYDLQESPWPGSPAAGLIRRIVPAPDVVVLPDAPIGLVHTRKPERPASEQAAEQERYRKLLAERPARHAELIIDTSGTVADPLAELVATVIEAAHQPRGTRRQR